MVIYIKQQILLLISFILVEEKVYSGNKGHHMSELSKDKMRVLVKCPHCPKIGGLNGMKANHFDNCKFKK